MTKKLFGLVLALLLAFTVLGGAAPVGAAADGASVTLSVDQAAFDASQSVVVHVTIANPTSRPVKVLKWYTAAEDVEEALFSVSVDGQPAQYIGAIYKRPGPKSSDYITLKSGESLTRDVDLAAYYDLSVSGSYTVRYAVASAQLYNEKASGLLKRIDTLESNEINVWVEGRQAPALAEAAAPLAVSGGTSYTKCTASQQSTLVSARSQASTYAANALSYLQGNSTGPRYTTWFGAFASNRYSTVTSHFSSIKSAMDTAAINFNCGCKKKYYAYVYPNQPYGIYVCSVFWTAPLTGTDSKAGTLIHEMSHFNVVASTDDYVYGQAGAKNLAITDPAKAIDNADNHEYFAENTPAQQ